MVSANEHAQRYTQDETRRHPAPTSNVQVWTQRPVSTSHNLTVLSSEPVTNHWPVESTDMARTRPVCPSNCAMAQHTHTHTGKDVQIEHATS